MEEKDQEPALVARARRGDAEAWEALYRRVYPRLLGYARRRLDGEAARDAVSETMARAVAGIERFGGDLSAGGGQAGGAFEPWLFGILRHVVIDAQRAHGQRTETNAWPTLGDAAGTSRASLSSPRPAEPPDDKPGPLDQVLGAEEALALRAAFEELSDEDREVLELRVVAGLTSEQAAEVLGKKPGAVRMAQTRALTRLRERMEKGR